LFTLKISRIFFIFGQEDKRKGPPKYSPVAPHSSDSSAVTRLAERGSRERGRAVCRGAASCVLQVGQWLLSLVGRFVEMDVLQSFPRVAADKMKPSR